MINLLDEFFLLVISVVKLAAIVVL
jgi:hypothetical protein